VAGKGHQEGWVRIRSLSKVGRGGEWARRGGVNVTYIYLKERRFRDRGAPPSFGKMKHNRAVRNGLAGTSEKSVYIEFIEEMNRKIPTTRNKSHNIKVTCTNPITRQGDHSFRKNRVAAALMGEKAASVTTQYPSVSAATSAPEPAVGTEERSGGGGGGEIFPTENKSRNCTPSTQSNA